MPPNRRKSVSLGARQAMSGARVSFSPLCATRGWIMAPRVAVAFCVWAGLLVTMADGLGCSAGSPKINLTLGFIFPLFKEENGTLVRAHQAGFERCAGALLAVDHINRGVGTYTDVPPKLTSCVHVRPCVVKNSANSATIGVSKAFEYATTGCGNSPVDVVIGPSGSSVASKVSVVLGLFAVPSISFASTAPELSNKKLFPYFARTVPPDTRQAMVFMDILRTFKWRKVGIFYDQDDVYSNGLFHALLALLSKEENSFVTVPFKYNHELASSGSAFKEEVISQVKASNARIFLMVLPPRPGQKILSAVQNTYVGHKDYAWIVSDAMANQKLMVEFGGDTKKLVGVLGVKPSLPRGPLYDAFVRDIWTRSLGWENATFKPLMDSVPAQHVQSLLTAHKSFTSSPDGKVAFAYDAVLVSALAAQKAAEKGGYARADLGKAIMDVLKSSTLKFSSGLSGNVALDAHGDNSAASYDIVNYQLDMSSAAIVLNTVHRWPPKDGGIDRQWANNVTFYGNHIPSDGVEASSRGSAATLAIPAWIVSVLVCFVGLLMLSLGAAIRMAILSYQQRQSKGRSKVDTSVWIKLYAGSNLLRLFQVSGRVVIVILEAINLQTLIDGQGLYKVQSVYQVFFGLYLLSAFVEMCVKLNEVRLDCETLWKGIAVDKNKSVRFSVSSPANTSTIKSTGDPDIALKRVSQRLRLAYFYGTNLVCKTIPFLALKVYLVSMDSYPDGVKYECTFPSGCEATKNPQSPTAGANMINMVLICLLATSAEKEFFQMMEIRSHQSRKKRLKNIIMDMSAIRETHREGQPSLRHGDLESRSIVPIDTSVPVDSIDGTDEYAPTVNPLFEASKRKKDKGSAHTILPIDESGQEMRLKSSTLSIHLEEVMMVDR